MSYSHLGDTTPKARKPHRCYLCGLPIVVGETHVRRAAVDDEGFVSIRMHAACEATTNNWDEDNWEHHDPDMFRKHLPVAAAEGGAR